MGRETVRDFLTCLISHRADPPPDRILFYAANGFAQSIMPYSDENGVPTSPTIEAISAFFGVQDNGDGTYTKVPEKLLPGPDGA